MSKFVPSERAKTIAVNWIAALRSGAYPQARYCLNKAKGFCCLGVLADLYVNTRISEEKYRWEPVENDEQSFRLMELGVPGVSHALLPASIRKELDMDGDFQNKLCRLNDSGKTFKQIASYIKRKYGI